MLMDDSPLRGFLPKPCHAIYFQRSSSSTTIISVVLFGEALFKLPVDTAGQPLPTTAWLLDPATPMNDGRLTFNQLVTQAAIRAGLYHDQ